VVAATTGVSWRPWLLFALPGGVLVDRVDRRRLMVAIDWVRVAAMSVLAVALLTGWAGIVLLDGVLFVINAGEVVFRSANQAMTPSVVRAVHSGRGPRPAAARHIPSCLNFRLKNPGRRS
jgi:hypothetical protein